MIIAEKTIISSLCRVNPPGARTTPWQSHSHKINISEKPAILNPFIDKIKLNDDPVIALPQGRGGVNQMRN